MDVEVTMVVEGRTRGLYRPRGVGRLLLKRRHVPLILTWYFSYCHGPALNGIGQLYFPFRALVGRGPKAAPR
jgi:hypothetical protein